MYRESGQVQCPYCWEMIWMDVDPSGGDVQNFIEDCEVCCKPIQYIARLNDEGEYDIEARTS